MRAEVGVAALTLALSVLTSCGMGNPARVALIGGEQRTLVLNAVEEFRKALNQGTCESALDLAVERLRNGKQAQDWVEHCHHIREAWGEWRSFDANYWYRSGNSAIAVEGVAEFTKGSCVVQIVWNVQSTSPRMLWFFLRSRADRIDFPSMPSPQQIDPPRRDGRAFVSGLHEEGEFRYDKIASVTAEQRQFWPLSCQKAG
jgi:hypothetical protein